MKLSTKTRYGTRMILEMAQHYGQGAIQLREIANRQDISLKYLEQIIRPLKEADYIKSFRGAKGGHILSKPPEEISDHIKKDVCKNKFIDYLTSDGQSNPTDS